MSKRRHNLEFKTALFIGLSTVLHAGLIIYVAASNYGNDFSDNITPGTSDSVVVDFTPATTATPSPEKVSEAPAELPAPKIITAEVKNTKLPEKAPAKISKAEENINTPVVSENPESIPVAVATAEPVVAPEQAPEQALVEQIRNDVVTPAPDSAPAPLAESQPEAQPEIVADTQTEATAVVPESVPAEAAVSAIVEKSGPAGNSNVASEPAIAMPIRQHSELKAMPGNQDPTYNFDDRLAKREGEIKFLAEVTPEGAVTNVRMLKSTGHKSLDIAALRSFKSYRYQPGQQGYVLKSFNFVLKGPARQLPSRLADRAANSLAK